MPTFYVFVRDWYKPNPEWPEGREPCAGPEEVIARNVATEKEAKAIAHDYNFTHNPGPMSRKAEFSEEA